MTGIELSDYKIDRGPKYIIDSSFIQGWDVCDRIFYTMKLKNMIVNSSMVNDPPPLSGESTYIPNSTRLIQSIHKLVHSLYIRQYKEFSHLKIDLGFEEGSTCLYFPVICGELFPIALLSVSDLPRHSFFIYTYIFKLYVIENNIKISTRDIKTKDFGIYDIKNKELISIEHIASCCDPDNSPCYVFDLYREIHLATWMRFFIIIFKMLTTKELSPKKLEENMQNFIQFSSPLLSELNI